MDFQELVTKIHKQKGTPIDETRNVLCFDPGHTTGWAFFEGLELIDFGEIKTEPIDVATHSINDLMEGLGCVIDAVVIEDYRVYKWRAKHHVGSEMLTTRVIGCIETLCTIKFIEPIVKQPAHAAKKFVTDKKLREWGFYQKGTKHANDAIRHGCYYLLFGAIEQKQRKGVTVG